MRIALFTFRLVPAAFRAVFRAALFTVRFAFLVARVAVFFFLTAFRAAFLTAFFTVRRAFRTDFFALRTALRAAAFFLAFLATFFTALVAFETAFSTAFSAFTTAALTVAASDGAGGGGGGGGGNAGSADPGSSSIHPALCQLDSSSAIVRSCGTWNAAIPAAVEAIGPSANAPKMHKFTRSASGPNAREPEKRHHDCKPLHRMNQPATDAPDGSGFLMRAIVLKETGGLEHLALADVPAPQVQAPHDVRVRVRAAALNRLDLFVADGLPGVAYTFPHIVGSDAAGIVESVGSAVTAVRPGDRVMVNPGISCGTCIDCLRGDESTCPALQVLGEHRSGTLAELLVVPESNLGIVPAAMDWPQAAAFSLATLTAWHMLVARARLERGETVLIWGAGGGVAQAAVQVAVHAGARVIATSGRSETLAVAQELGAHDLINHATDDVVARVRAITANRGADVIVDSVGEPTWSRSTRLLRRGGRLVTCGATGGPHVAIDLRRLFWHQWSLMGSTLGTHADYREIVRLAGEGVFWPHVDQVVPFERSVEAFHRLARGEQTGKVVIDLG